MSYDSNLDPAISDMMSPNSSHGSPLFDFLTAFAPRKLKDLFRLCEYLYFNSSQIYAALQKFCTYPVTDLVYNSTNEALVDKYKHLHNKVLKTKRRLLQAAIDKFVYGNFFGSVSLAVRSLSQVPRLRTPDEHHHRRIQVQTEEASVYVRSARTVSAG